MLSSNRSFFKHIKICLLIGIICRPEVNFFNFFYFKFSKFLGIEWIMCFTYDVGNEYKPSRILYSLYCNENFFSYHKIYIFNADGKLNDIEFNWCLCHSLRRDWTINIVCIYLLSWRVACLFVCVCLLSLSIHTMYLIHTWALCWCKKW